MNKLPQIYSPAPTIQPPLPVDEPTQSNVLNDVVRAVRDRKLLVVSLTLLGAVIATVLLLWTPPTYQAVATLEVQGLNENFMNMTAVDPQAGTGAYSSNSVNIQTQLRILESLSLRQPVIDRLQRETTPMLPPQTSVLAKLRKAFHIGTQDPLESTREAIMMAGQTVKGRAVLGTRIIAVTCESTNPDIAANFANALAADYIAESSEAHSVNAQKTSQWLAAQLEETKAKLSEAESRLQDFAQKSGITFVGEQQTLADSGMQVLQNNLAALQAETIAKRTALEKVMNAPPDALGEIVQDVDIKNYVGRLNDLKRERAGLLVKFTPEFQKIKEIDAQMAVLQTAFDKQRENVLARYRTDYEEAIRRQKLTAAAYGKQAGQVGAEAEKMAHYAGLKRESDMLRQTLNAILQQSNQAAITSALPTNSVRVVDGALAPKMSYAPVLKSQAIKGAGLGFAAGIGLALFIERRRRKVLSLRFNEPGRSALLLNIRELGVIPSVELNAKPAGVRGLIGGSGPKPEHAFFMKESFRMVVASLLRPADGRDQPRLVMVTSPGPGEGKTTLVSHIAEAMAESGKKILVVNADLRRPHLDDVLGVSGEPGLSNIIASDELLTGAFVDRFVKFVSTRSIHVLPAGTASGDLTRLFYSAKMEIFFEVIQAAYDCILVDTPPLLQFTEARLLGRMMDGVVLVLRSGSTDEGDALAARQLLINDNISLLGTVLNGWRAPSKNPYMQYYYSPKVQ